MTAKRPGARRGRPREAIDVERLKGALAASMVFLSKSRQLKPGKAYEWGRGVWADLAGVYGAKIGVRSPETVRSWVKRYRFPRSSPEPLDNLESVKREIEKIDDVRGFGDLLLKHAGPDFTWSMIEAWGENTDKLPGRDNAREEARILAERIAGRRDPQNPGGPRIGGLMQKLRRLERQTGRSRKHADDVALARRREGGGAAAFDYVFETLARQDPPPSPQDLKSRFNSYASSLLGDPN